ncbi:MAG: hypothetical protein AABY07_02970 [Nanoarchaeota archaeon]
MTKQFIGLNGKPIKGESPIVVIDCGAIIDLECALRRTGLPEDNAGLLLYSNPNTYVITPLVMKELESHRNMRINGKVKELETATLEYCHTICRRSGEMLLYLQDGTGYPKDNIGLDVYLANYVAFEEGHKKRDIDPISMTDREILTIAFYMAQTRPQLNELGKVIIASPDAHIRHITSLLNKQDRYPYKVEYYSTRKGRK